MITEYRHRVSPAAAIVILIVFVAVTSGLGWQLNKKQLTRISDVVDQNRASSERLSELLAENKALLTTSKNLGTPSRQHDDAEPYSEQAIHLLDVFDDLSISVEFGAVTDHYLDRGIIEQHLPVTVVSDLKSMEAALERLSMVSIPLSSVEIMSIADDVTITFNVVSWRAQETEL